MNINIQCQGFQLTPAIREHVQRELSINLANFDSRIQAVDVYLRDVNGPRGGEDMRAVICVRLMPRQVVKVECTRSDLYVAITRTARRSKRAVKRSINKYRQMEKLTLRELRQFSH